METKGLVVIWGFLALCISLIVTGYMLPHSWYAALMLIVGIIGGIAWMIGVFMIATAMNSDI